ncbi:MAG: hypothetical protein GY925_21095 [Actinomycetia bacterium]|nr:hypothetical protein [Actinomycetes bacterium]
MDEGVLIALVGGGAAVLTAGVTTVAPLMAKRQAKVVADAVGSIDGQGSVIEMVGRLIGLVTSTAEHVERVDTKVDKLSARANAADVELSDLRTAVAAVHTRLVQGKGGAV